MISFPGIAMVSRIPPRIVSVAVCVVILLWYIMVQTINFTPAATEVDTDGYLAFAQRIAHGDPIAVVENDPFQWQNHVWIENQRGELLPKYAPGLPLLMAMFQRVCGDSAMFMTSPALGALALIGAFLLFSMWMGPLPATLAFFTLATNIMFVNYATYPLTHIADLCCAVWGAYFLWRWLAAPSIATGLCAGLLLGFATVIRFTNISLILMMLSAIGTIFWQHRHKSGTPHRAIAFMLTGYGVVIAMLMVYNWRYFGNPLHTGYHLSGEQSAFSLAYFVHNYPILNMGLSGYCLFTLFGFGLVGLVLSGPVPERLMRIGWAVPVFLVYAGYYWAPPNASYYRFMLTAIPVMIGSAYMFMAHHITGTAVRNTVMILLTAVTLVQNGPDLIQIMHGRSLSRSARYLDDARSVITSRTAPDAVMFTTPPFAVFFGTLRRNRLYNLESFESAHADRAFPENHPNPYAPKGQPSRFKRLRAFYAATTVEQFASYKKKLIDDFLDAGRQVVMFIPAARRQQEQSALGKDYALVPLTLWNASWRETWFVYDVRRIVPES